MAITATFSPTTQILTSFGDNLNNTMTFSRNAAGTILVNGGAVAIKGGTATVGRAELVTANAAKVLETRCSWRGIFLEIAGDRAARRPPNGLPPPSRFTFPP